MTQDTMTPIERTMTTLGHQEPDRVPMFLLVSMVGSKGTGLTIEEYFSKAEYVIEGQLRMQKEFKNDCYYNLFYAAIETEAWGKEINSPGTVIFVEDGPPNNAQPFIEKPSDIKKLKAPDPYEHPKLQELLKATAGIKEQGDPNVPILGVLIGPFSLPVMQLGFDNYMALMYEDRELMWDLWRKNVEWCIAWGKAQLEAGCTALCYFDPVMSSTLVPRELYLETGNVMAKEVIPALGGPTVSHFAAGRGIPILNDVAETGTLGIGISVIEDLAEVKEICKGKLTVIGNLNGIAMRNWSREEATAIVKEAIIKAGPGGGFILSDNHGEIPFQTPPEVLHYISDAVHEWGRYPIEWKLTEQDLAIIGGKYDGSKIKKAA